MTAILLNQLDKSPFDRLARLAVRLTEAPMTLVSVMEDGELRGVSWIGLPEPWETTGEIPHPYPFCEYVVRTGELDVIEDTAGHPRMVPGSAGELFRVAAYLGIPLQTEDGETAGVFAVMDDRPREWSLEQVEALQDLARAAVTEVELRARTRALERAQAKLQESEGQLSSLMSNLPGQVYRCRNEPDWPMEFVSPGVTELTGYSPEDFLDRRSVTYAELIHPDDREEVWSEVQRALAERRSYRLTYRIRTREGAERWVWEQGRGVYHGNELQLLEGLVVDVTDRKRMEAKLRENEARFRALTENSLDIVNIIGADGTVLYVSPSAQRVLGYRPDEMTGRSAFEFIHPDDAARVAEVIGQVVAQPDQTHFVEFRFRHADGRWLTMESLGQSHLDDPAIRGIVSNSRDVTQRREMDEELRESEQRFRTLSMAAPIGIFVTDEEGQVTFVNQRWEEISGLSAEKSLGSRWIELIHPEERDRVVDDWMRHGRLSRHYQTVLRIVRPDGEERWVATHATALLAEDGTLLGHVGTGEDITERRRVENALRESESRFRLMVESVRDYAIILLDPQGRVVHWNGGAERVKGYTEGEILGRHLTTFYPEEDRARGKPERILDIARREGHFEDEGWRVRKDGSCFWASVVVTALRDEAGALLGFAKITRDLTERHLTEERLRRQSDMVRLLQHTAVAANAARTVQEALTDAIEHISAHLRLPVGHAFVRAEDGSGELVPTGIWRAARLERFEPFRRLTEQMRFGPGQGLPGRALETAEPVWSSSFGEDQTFLRGGAAAECGLRAGLAFPVRVGDEVVAVLELFSERPLEPDAPLLETLSNIGTQLGRVFERSRAESAVLRAKEEAEQANRAKSEFLSRMSHELRTPLNAILGFGQLLEMDLQKEEDRESVYQILNAGRHLLALIDEVLDLAKIEAGRITLSTEPVPAARLIADSVSLVTSLAAQRGVQVVVEHGGSDVHVLADQQRLKQVLLNLLSNAIKYNHAGGQVTIACRPAADERLRLEVRDTGRGISQDKLERLFTPFDRLDAERTEVEGTGLGLALTKSLVEVMGGTIGVQSAPGAGSTFWVELPLVHPPGDRYTAADVAERAPQATEPAAAAKTILYIEDNLSNLRLVERILARRPELTLVPAMQGRLGLDLAREIRPDLILLDVHLPDLEGEEVLRRLQGNPELREVPVVIVSADATPRQVERFMAAGARAYLTKPLDVQRFREVLDHSLGVEGER